MPANVPPADNASDSFLLAIVSALLLVFLLLRLRGLFQRKLPAEVDAWVALGFVASSPVVRKAIALQNATPRWRRLIVDNAVFVSSDETPGGLMVVQIIPWYSRRPRHRVSVKSTLKTRISSVVVRHSRR